MSKKNKLMQWGEQAGLTRLPDHIEYDGSTETLDLSHTSVDMIPLGLKGVRVVFSNQPFAYIAPDFEGEVVIKNSYGISKKMTRKEIKNAQDTYTQDHEYVESERYDSESGLLCVLPLGMRFSYHKFTAHLDLTRTTISKRPDIFGITVTMPKHKVNHVRPIWEERSRY